MNVRRHRPIAGALATLWLAAGAAAAAPVPAVTAQVDASHDFSELLGLLAARRHGRVSFTEVHEMAMLERPLRSSGELLYEAPDHLEKRTLEPRRETLILEHGVLTAQRGHRSHVLRLRDYPQVVPFVESIRATLAGDRAALEHYFHVQFSGDLGHWALELVPIDATVARTVREIRISGERETIRSVAIRQSDGDRSLLTIGAEVPPVSGAGRAGTLVWTLAVLLAAVIVARATYVADLSAFLPRAPTAAQRLLVEQLRAGPAVHLIMLAIEGGAPETRAQLSLQLAARLRAAPAFAAVNNGDAAQLQRDREFLFAHRYLLAQDVTPQRFTVAGLHAAIGDSLDALAAPEGLLLKPLFPRDPTGELLAILDSLGAGAAPHTDGGVWSSPNGARALLLVQTRAAGSDTDAQQAACEAIRRAFAATVAGLPAAQRAAPRLLMSGPPVFAVESRAIIKQEVLRLSTVSAVLITVLLLAVYRSLPALVLTLVPVLSGALAGVAAVALGFGAVHGITLGFGVTLIGEAVDYSIYLFIQSGGDFRRAVWPTIRLGVLTSICGFAALLPSAFPGLAQLGLYSIAGLVAAALVTRFVLPHWARGVRSVRDLSAAGEKLARALAGLQRRHAAAALALLALAAGAVLYLQRGALFSRELAALNPIPVAAQRLDDELRADAGAPDVRYIAVASGTDREAALAAAQRLSGRLTPLVDAGVIGSFQSPTRYLPPRAVQLARQASLPAEGELRARLAAALAGLPVKPAVLEPFVADVAAARRAAPLTEAALAGTSLAAATDALLVQTPAGWSALLPVAVADGDLAPGALARLRAAVGAQDGAPLLDLKAEADALYGGYLAAAGRLALLGLAAIVVLLAVALRSAARVARVVAPLVLAVLAVAALLVVTHHRLTILHVVGMLLIVAVGSNYALFFDRSSARPYEGSVPRTLASLGVANAATVIAFGVLAFSRVPVLADLGSTVAPGTLLALWFSGLLARPAAAGRA